MENYKQEITEDEVVEMLQSNKFQENSILDMYKQAGNIYEVQRLFKRYQHEIGSFFEHNGIDISVTAFKIMFMQKFGGVLKLFKFHN